MDVATRNADQRPAGDQDRGVITRAARAARKSKLSSALTDPKAALEEARRQAEGVASEAEGVGTKSGVPFDPNTTKGQQPGL